MSTYHDHNEPKWFRKDHNAPHATPPVRAPADAPALAAAARRHAGAPGPPGRRARAVGQHGRRPAHRGGAAPGAPSADLLPRRGCGTTPGAAGDTTGRRAGHRHRARPRGLGGRGGRVPGPARAQDPCRRPLLRRVRGRGRHAFAARATEA